MTGSVVVGYTATDAGADAAALGARIARSLGATLHLVIVLPNEGQLIAIKRRVGFESIADLREAGAPSWAGA